MAKNKITLAIVAGIIGMLLLAPGHQAHAQSFISGIVGGAVGWVAYILVYLTTLVAGVLISLVTYLIAVFLALSNNIANTYVVQVGNSVVLAIANLGFVLAIIVIAIATILKREPYGIKKSLWRLIVAAILVNFSLVIGGAIINFSNSLTNTFLSKGLPVAGTADRSAGYMAFAEQLAGAFAPQRALLGAALGNSTTTSISNSFSQSSVGTSLKNAGNDSTLAAVLTPFISVVSAAGFLIVIVITLCVFLIMLMVRYVYLSILLILMPIAWLAWIFESTKGNFLKWWRQFFRWTFFAPIVIFFLWLAIATAQAMQAKNDRNPLAYLDGTRLAQNGSVETSNPITGALADFGGFMAQFAATMLQGGLVVGLAVGGMIAANKFSIMGASHAVDAMKSSGKAVGNYASKQAKKGARWTYQRTPAERLTNRLQRIPGVSVVGRGIANVAEKGGKDLVKSASSDLKLSDLSDDRLAMAAQGTRGHENTLAILAEAQKRGKLSKLGKVGGEDSLEAYLAKNDRAFADYGQGKLKGDIDNALMSNNAMRNTAKTVATGGAATAVADTEGLLGPAGESVRAGDLLRAQSEKFFEGKNKSDMNAARAGDLFGAKENFGLSKEAIDALSKAITHGIALKTPTLVSSVASKLDSSLKLNDFARKYKESLEDAVRAGKMTRETADELSNASKSIRSAIFAGYSTGPSGTEAPPAASTTPPPRA